MIIWIRNRKGWIAAVFFFLAALFALSFIIGGVGTGNNASLSDIFGNSGGSAGTTGAVTGSISSLTKAAKAHPKSATAWQNLANAYETASQSSGAATAWEHVIKLKPTDSDALTQLALAQAQVATNQANEAQSLETSATSASPASDTTFSGGTLGTLSEDPVTLAQAAQDADQQTQELKQANTAATKANTWWKKSTSTYAKIVALPSFAKNTLQATIWLNYGSAAQSANDTTTALKAYGEFLKIAPDDPNAAQVKSIVKQLKAAAKTSSTSTTTTGQ
jgi:tetratricopeptide (TPR) repeat protein